MTRTMWPGSWIAPPGRLWSGRGRDHGSNDALDLPPWLGHNRHVPTVEEALPVASRTSAERAPSVPRTGWRAPPLLSPITLGIVLILMLLVAYLIGSWINDRRAARSIAVFAIGVVSFLGMLGLSHRDTAG